MNQANHDFDFSAALKAIQEGKPLLGKEGFSPRSSKNSLKQPLKGSWIHVLAKKSPPTAAMGKAKRPSNH